MRLSMVMIARNERENVRPCFDSFWDHVDEVVLCDTGSRDGTIGEARRYARERGEPAKLIVGRFKWCDDFAAARNHAHSLAGPDGVHAWIDLDDRLVGGRHLRRIVQRFARNPDLGSVDAAYVWRLKRTGNPSCRLIRAPVTWANPTYERPLVTGEVGRTTKVRWHHHGAGQHGRRDFDIAVKWMRRAPEDWWPWMAAACEAAFPLGDFALAERYGRRALELDRQEEMVPVQRAQLLEIQALAAYKRGDAELAASLALQAVKRWPRVRCCLLLAVIAFKGGDYAKAQLWATRAREVSRDHPGVAAATDWVIAASRRRRAAVDHAELTGNTLGAIIARQASGPLRLALDEL